MSKTVNDIVQYSAFRENGTTNKTTSVADGNPLAGDTKRPGEHPWGVFHILATGSTSGNSEPWTSVVTCFCQSSMKWRSIYQKDP